MSIPQHIGPATPRQIVEVRLGRLSRYAVDGGGWQHWNEAEFPCTARVGTNKSNPHYSTPWQALWVPTTAYVPVPNVLEVKTDKKLEIGGIGTATVEIENILYTPKAGGWHERERGAMSPLRGYFAHGDELSPDMAPLLDELERIVGTNEWEGRFAYAAQITIYQGYGSELAKVFTGLIEDIDSTSKPDRITMTCRDFGQVFTDTHFFGWGKDPVIDTPVVFIDSEDASLKQDVGYNAHSSNEDAPHTADKVLDFSDTTWWATNVVHSAEQTEYVEIALPEGVYHFADIRLKWGLGSFGYGGPDLYMSLRPALLTGGLAPTRQETGKLAQDLTTANNWLDAQGWVDLTKKEERKVPGVNGGNSYLELRKNYPAGNQRTPLEENEGSPVAYRVGKNSVLRISFRKLFPIEGGWKAGVEELHGLREATEAAAGREQWVITQDISDVIRIICQWAGFKEWNIEQTGTRLPKRIVAFQSETYLDVIKQICEGIGFTFFMADPAPDANPRGPESLGIPTFRKSQVVANDFGRSLPIITDRSLLTAIDLKQSNEPLSYVIRVYGITKSLPGNMAASIVGGQRVSYTFRPPWTGTPPTYADSRLGGILKQLVHTDPLFSTTDLCRNAAWFIALRQAIESTEATIEFPAFPGLDLDDHALLMDLGTGISTRIAVLSRSSTFTDGEKRKFVMTVSGALIDTPDVRDMVNIINGEADANGSGGVWVDPKTGTGSSLGYG